MMLDWQQAAWLAAALVVLGWTLRLAGRGRLRALAPFAIEGAMISALYSVWQVANTISRLSTAPAFARARWIEHAERVVGLPSERDLQPLVDHRLIATPVNLYYASMHFTVMGIFLIWLFVRHRERYRAVRRVLAVATLGCLLIQFWPVAPPRLLPGFTDIALKYHQSVYGLGFDALSAMPSVHVCWAVLVGVSVWRVSPSRWRFVGPLHTVLTVFVVVSTANHWWADGIVATAVLGVAVLVVRGAERALAPVTDRLRPRVAVPQELSPAGAGGILPS